MSSETSSIDGVHRKLLQLRIRRQPEEQAEHADDQPAHQQRPAVDATEIDRRQVRQHEAGFTAFGDRRRRRLDRLREERHRDAGRRGQGGHRASSRTRTTDTSEASLYKHGHLTSHKRSNYNFSRGGSAMPPVRKILMPSSTAMSGNVTRSRSQITTSPR